MDLSQTLQEIDNAISLTKGEVGYHAKNADKYGNRKVWQDSTRAVDAIDALKRLEKIKIILGIEIKLEAENDNGNG